MNRAWEDFTGVRREAVIGRAALIPAVDEGRADDHAHERALIEKGGGRALSQAP